ncbi:MAG: hypothetical protein H7210_13260 [Pyrinomonadaceae bacterium]|nr:hypothetical protein [Phycisphaerales bacterium]
MRMLTAVGTLLLCSGAALADVYHDDGTSTAGVYPVSGPVFVDHGPIQRGGTLVYDRSVETGSRANGGNAGFTVGAPADAARVLFDDVPIPAALLNGATSLDVCRVTVGIRRLANAPATDVNVFWSSVTTTVVAPDTNLDTPPSLLGTASLAANGAAAVTQLVTFGVTGGPTLFNTPLNSDFFAGFGTFAVGVSLSNTDANNGWRVTSGPAANATGLFWLYDPNLSAQTNPEGAYSFGTTVPSSFYIVIEGNPVPAPGAAALLGLGGLLAARRRR